MGMQPSHKCRQLGERQGREVPYVAILPAEHQARCWQGTGGIIEAPGTREFESCPNALEDTTGCFLLLVPDGPKRLRDGGGGDVPDRQATEQGKRIGGQRGSPLRDGLGIAWLGFAS
jgi:hypothetical protein